MPKPLSQADRFDFHAFFYEYQVVWRSRDGADRYTFFFFFEERRKEIVAKSSLGTWESAIFSARADSVVRFNGARSLADWARAIDANNENAAGRSSGLWNVRQC